MNKITSINVIQTIVDASTAYAGATDSLHLAVQTLYQVYVAAKAEPGIESAIKQQYAVCSNAPKTNRLSNRIAFIAFTINKRRVSEIHKVLTAAENNNVLASDFASWIKKRGGLAVVYRESASKSKKSGISKSNRQKASYFDAIKQLSDDAKKKTVSLDNPAPCTLGDEEIAAQFVRRDKAGNYSTFWVKLSESNTEFFEAVKVTPGTTTAAMPPMASNDDLISAARIISTE